MPYNCHQIGNQSTHFVTKLGASVCYQSGDIFIGMKVKFPNNLKAVMEAKRIGPTELVKKSGVSKQNISRFRKGDRELTPIWAERLAPHLEVQPEVLIFASKKVANTESQPVGIDSLIRNASPTLQKRVRAVVEALLKAG